MTLSLELTPALEARLESVAAARGENRERLALAALGAGLAALDAEAAEFEDACAGIAEGLADVEARRTISLEDYRAQWESEKALRKTAT